MTMKKILILFLNCCVTLSAFADFDWIFTNSIIISEVNTNYDGQSILVSNTTVTIDGVHTFTNLYLANSAVITHTVGNTNGLQLAVSDTLYISTNSSIDVSGLSTNNPNPNSGVGGSYGGHGGRIDGKESLKIYGEYTQPVDLGSRSYDQNYTFGGGRLKIVADTVIIDGEITADGDDARSEYYEGGASGGSVWLVVKNLSGIGRIHSNGGKGGAVGGGGGGGRIAIEYDQTNSFDLIQSVSCVGGLKQGTSTANGGAGTVYLKDTAQSLGVLRVDNTGIGTNTQATVLNGTVSDSVVLVNANVAITNTTQLSSLTVSNSVMSQGGALSVSNLILLSGAVWTQTGTLSVSNLMLHSGAMLTQNAVLTAGAINFSGGTFVQNATLDIGSGNLTVSNWTWECNYPQTWNNITVTNGGKVTHTAGNTNGLQLTVSNTLYISTNSSIDVSECGAVDADYPTGGLSHDFSGGSYGGYGGGSLGRYLHAIYGDYKQPVDVGCGALAAKGGGRVKIRATTLILDGKITADGQAQEATHYGGGGSGGSIWLDVNAITGAGYVRSDGGNAECSGGGGGGGRIAIYYGQGDEFSFVDQISCMGGLKGPSGAGQNGGGGSVYIQGSGTHVDSPGMTNFLFAVTNYITTTNVILQGTKGANMSVWADWQQIASNNSMTIWSGSVNLTQGVNQVQVYARDISGNCSEVSNLTFFVDSLAPALDSMNPAGSINYSFSSITLNYTETGSGLDANATLTNLFVSGAATNGGLSSTVAGTWSVLSSTQLQFVPQFTPLEGFYTVQGTLQDNFGLKSSFTNTFTVTFAVPPAPTVGAFSPATGISIMTFTGGKQADTYLYMNGVNLSNYSSTVWSKTENLISGANNFAFKVKNAAGTFSASTNVTVTYTDVIPGPVTNLTTITNGIGTEITLIWTNYNEYANGADITNYLIYKATSNFTDTIQVSIIATNAAGVQNLLVTNLTRGVTNWYAVVPVDKIGQKQTNNLTSFGFAPNDIVPPLNPSAITFECSTTGLVLHWPHIDDVDSDFSTYRLYPTNSTTAVEITNNTFTLNGLEPSSSYQFKVSSVDATGNENTNGTLATGYTAISPNPTGLTVTEVYSGRVSLQWNPVVSSGNVKHYAIYSSTNDFSSVEGMTPRVTTASTNCGVAGLPNGIASWFAVTAVNKSDGELKEVSTVSATPQADTNGPALSNLQWNNSVVGTLTAPGTFSITASDPAGVSRVEFRIGDTLIGEKVGNSPYSAFWNVAGTPSNGIYTLSVTAYDSLNNVSNLTTGVDVTLAKPPAPTNILPVEGSAFNVSNVTFSGTASVYANSAVFSNFGGSSAISSAGTFSRTLTLTEGTNEVRAAAVNRAGQGEWSAARAVVVNTKVPNPPFNLKATSRAGGVIRLDWWEPQGVNVKDYVIYRSEHAFTNATEATWSTVTGSRTYFDVTSTNSTFYYRVSDRNTAGTESALSDIASATADDKAPVATVSYTSTGNSVSRSNTTAFAAGTVSVQVWTDEELLTVPFFNIVRSGGLPILVDLKKQSITNYTGSFVITESMASGDATILFSCSDKVGNETTVIAPTNKIIIDTQGPAITGLSVLPASPIRTASTNPASVAVQFEFKDGEVPTGSFDFGYRLSDTQPNSVTPITLITGITANKRTGTFTLPPTAASNAGNAERLEFVFVGKDLLNNTNTMVIAAGQVYQGTNLPPSDVPAGLTGKALPGGKIQLDWNTASNAITYEALKGSSSNVVNTSLGFTGGATTYTNTFGNTTNWFAVRSVRTANGQTNYSAACTATQVVSDAVAPVAPTNLTIQLAGNGMCLTWKTNETTACCSLYRSTDSNAGYSCIISNIPGTNVVDPNPLKGPAYYRVTALDVVGNESTPSMTVYTNVSLVPVNSLTVTKAGTEWPVVEWTYPESGAINGYHLYLDRNGLPVPISKTAPFFTDTGYDAASNRSYTVAAKDPNNESLGRTIELPQLTAVPDAGNRIDRGVMNRLAYTVTNAGAQAVSNVQMQAVVNGAQHFSTNAVTVPAFGSVAVSLAVGGYSNLPDRVMVTNTVLINPNPGEEVRIAGTEQYDVGNNILSAELITTNFTRGGAGSVQFVLRNTGRETVEVLMAKNGQASPDVRFKLLNGENLYAVQSVTQIVNGVINRGTDSLAVIAPGESFIAQAVSINVPTSAPDQVIIKLEIDHLYYGYGYENQITIDGLQTTRKVNLLETPYYATVTNITVIPTNAIGTNVLVSGQTVNRGSSAPLGNQSLKLVLARDGFERSFDLYSDVYGNWSYTFVPAAGEGGTFKVSAVHPAMTDRPDHGSFQLLNVKISPTYGHLQCPRNREAKLYADVTPVAGLNLTNLNFAFVSEDQTNSVTGITVCTNAPVAVLGGKTQRIECWVTGNTNADAKVQLILRVQSDEGFWGTVKLDAEFDAAVENVPVIEWTPNGLETGVAVSNRADEEIVLKNIGYANVSNAILRFTPKLPGWIYINGATNLGTFAVGSEHRIGLTIMPTNNASVGTNMFTLSLEGSNCTNTIPVVIYVDNSGVGDAMFHVMDIYTRWGTDTNAANYNGLGGARIQLVREDSAVVFITNITTAANGTVSVENLPVGRYRIRVSAKDHNDLGDRIWIKPGATESREYTLETPTVTVEWGVKEIELQDRYNIVLNATFKTDVPAPVVVIDPPSITLPDMQPGDVFNGEFTVKNYGLIRAENIKMTVPPADEYFKYELMNELPDTLEAQQSVRAAYRVTCLSSLPGGSGGCSLYQKCFDIAYDYRCANQRVFSGNARVCYMYRICDPESGPGSGGGGSDSGGGGGGRGVEGGGRTPIPSPEVCLPGAPGEQCPGSMSAFGSGGAGSGSGNGPGSGGKKDLLPATGRNADAGASVVNLLSGAFEEGLADLSVKIPGGYISMTRLYRDDRWIFNYPWNSISVGGSLAFYDSNSSSLTPISTYNPLDGRYIERNGIRYKCLNRDGTSYGYPQTDANGTVSFQYTFTKTDSGWQWRNARGEWINYNGDGAIQSYGDLQKTNAVMIYSSGMMTGVADGLGSQVLWISYTSNLISSVHDEMNRTVQYQYSINGLLTNVVDVLSNQTAYGYDAKGRLETVLEPDGDKHIISRYDVGQVKSVLNTNGVGRFFEYGYDSLRETYYAAEKHSDGTIIEYWHDGNNGSLLKRQRNGTVEYDSSVKEDDPTAPVIKKDAWGNITTITYADGTAVARAYADIMAAGTHGFVMTKEISETGITNLFAYDAKGNITNEVRYAGTALEKTTAYVYDSFGQLLSRRESGAGSLGTVRVTEYLYDPRGNTVSVTTPDGTVTTNTYNLLGSLLTSGRIANNEYLITTSNTFDAAGNLLMSFDAAGRMAQSNQYDAVGNRILSLDVAGRPTRYGYDFNGRATSVSNWLGEVTTRTYDFDGHILREDESKAESLTSKVYTYDDRGNLIQQKLITQNSELITLYEYDSKNRLVKTTDPAGNITQTVYNDRGLVATETRTTDNRQLTTSYVYDLRGRVLSQTVTTGAAQ